jgi:hypothetical protein
LNGIHLSNDLASLGISPTTEESLGREDTVNGLPRYYSTGGSPLTSQGISGPGRGRYGRVRSARSPLGTLSDGSNNWSNGRPAKPQSPQWATSK